MNDLKTVWVAFNNDFSGGEIQHIIKFVGVFATKEEADATNCDYTITCQDGVDYSKIALFNYINALNGGE